MKPYDRGFRERSFAQKFIEEMNSGGTMPKQVAYMKGYMPNGYWVVHVREQDPQPPMQLDFYYPGVKTYTFDDRGRRSSPRLQEKSGGGRREFRRGRLFVARNKPQVMKALRCYDVPRRVKEILADIAVECDSMVSELSTENDRYRTALEYIGQEVGRIHSGSIKEIVANALKDPS